MKIVYLDCRTVNPGDLSWDGLDQLGEWECYERTALENVVERIGDAEVVITNKVRMDESIFSQCPNLKLICETATGYDNIDIEYCKSRGIAVANTPGYSTFCVAQVTISIASYLMTRLGEYRDFVHNGKYSASNSANKLTPVYHELRGLTWGIIGCGNIGGAVARVAEAMGARVLVVKRKPDPRYNCTDLDTLCRESDIITVHCPLNDSTRGLIGKEQLSLMKPGAILVNEARGAVLDEQAVADAVVSGKLGGFGCDVYSTEPFSKDHPYNAIKDLDNVLLTPHAAWGAYEARVRCLDIICNNISSFINGENLNRVDK
jgi:glycerate dehydrogenase